MDNRTLSKYVHGVAGSFFGEQSERHFDEEVEHFRLNVVDTPGFGDTDKGWFDFFWIPYFILLCKLTEQLTQNYIFFTNFETTIRKT